MTILWCLILLFFILNGLSFQRDKIKKMLRARKKLNCREENSVKTICCGSTYAWHAFSPNESDECMVLAYKHQSLQEDFALLKKYGSKASQGADVIVALAPFTTLFRKTKEIGVQRNVYLLNRTEYRDWPMGVYIMNKFFPFVASVIYNVKEIFIPKDKAPLQNIVMTWKRTFHLVDFNGNNMSAKNQEAIQYNTQVLQQMVDYCEQKEYHLWIVTVPLTDKLNAVFSDSFTEMTIGSVIGELRGKFTFLDYRKDQRFREENLYGDGCFYLNENGSRAFGQVLCEDMKRQKCEEACL